MSCMNICRLGRLFGTKKYSKLLIDQSAEGVRGKMRYRKACATYPNKMKDIRKRLREKFPGLRQAKNDWLANRILRNVLHNSMPRPSSSKRKPRKCSSEHSVSSSHEEAVEELAEDISEEKIQGKHEWKTHGERKYVEETWMSDSDRPI